MKRSIAFLMLALLAGCAAPKGSGQQSVFDLWIDNGGGAVPYLSVIGDLSKVGWSEKGLPIGKIRTSQFTAEMAWMRAFDFDGDQIVRKAEMTQGWLVLIARLRTGTDYAPDILKTGANATSLRSLTGFILNVDEEKAMRSVLDGSGDGATQAAVKAMVKRINDIFESQGGGSDNGGGVPKTGGGGMG